MDSAGTSSKCATCPGMRVEFEVSLSNFFPDYTEEFPPLRITLLSSAKVPRFCTVQTVLLFNTQTG